MTVNPITKQLSPEERELQQKRANLDKLQTELVELEVQIAILKTEVEAFAEHYRATVGVKYAELDDLEAQIAEFTASIQPHASRAQSEARDARARANQTAEDVRANDPTTDPPSRNQPFQTSEDIKKLFREIAKQIHPDFALDETDKARRTVLMQEANQAYKKGDEAALRQLLDSFRHSPDVVQGTDVASQLVRIIRQIALVESRLESLQSEYSILLNSEIYQLLTKAKVASQAGRNLLREMSKSIEIQIQAALSRLFTLQRHHQSRG